MAGVRRLTIDELRQYVGHDPVTGDLWWLPRDGTTPRAASWNARFAWRKTFVSVGTKGYLQGRILGECLLAHRLMWALATGAWPKEQIDHINGDRTDNRLLNLREFSAAENARNRKRPNGRDGKVGVSWEKKTRKWHARIKVDGKNINLGRYHDFAVAVAARRDAEKQFGFAINHARHDITDPVRSSRICWG